MASVASDLTGGLFGNSPEWGKIAKRNEARRRGIIDLGMNQINAIYEGGSAPFYAPAKVGDAKFDPQATYYNLTGKGEFKPYWAPGGAHPSGRFHRSPVGSALATGGFDLGAALMVKGLGLDKIFGKEESPRDIARKKFRRGVLLSAPETKTFEGFQPEFFDERRKAYLDYALPQLSDQFQRASRATEYGLANRGLQDSSVATKARSDLARTSSTSRQSAADEAVNQSNQLRRDIENSRQQAIAQLYQTADPAQGVSSAIASASQFRAPSTFAPINNAFTGIAEQYYLNQLLNNYRQGAAGFNSPMNYSISPYLAPIT